MAHEIEIINGKASAAFVVTGIGDRQEPWHKLGTYVAEAMTAEQALELANLNWEVRLATMNTTDGIEVPSRVAVVRDTEAGSDVLGVVGAKWQPVQNREAFAFCDAVVQAAGDAHYETAGMLRPSSENMVGAQTFMVLSRPDLVLDPSGRADVHSRYLFCSNSFDGSRAFTLKMTNVRVVCKNTQELALRGAGAQFKVSHSTQNIERRISDAQNALGLVENFDAAFMAQAEALLRAEAPVEGKAFAQVMEAAFGALKSDATDIQKQRHAERLVDLQTIASASHNQNITGTLWGAYNTVTEFMDWARPSRTENSEVMATQTLTSPVVLNAKQRAFARAAELVSA